MNGKQEWARRNRARRNRARKRSREVGKKIPSV
jgi:hypothetical protein